MCPYCQIIMLTLRNRLRNNDLNIGILALWQFVLRNLVMFSLTLDACVSLLNGCRTLSAGCLHWSEASCFSLYLSTVHVTVIGLPRLMLHWHVDVLGSMCEVVTVLRIARHIQLHDFCEVGESRLLSVPRIATFPALPQSESMAPG